MQRDLQVTTIFVTQDQAEALAMADRIAVLEDGQVRQVGTPREVFRRPATTFVANFIGSTRMNLLPGEVHGDHVQVPGGAFELPHLAQIRRDAQAVIVGVRPEYLTLSATPTSDAVSGQVSIVEHLGTSSLVTVDVAGTMVGATVPEGAEPDAGARVWLRPAPGRMLLYRSQDGTLIG
jgi:multiple sugar transport system ATP-binding protein